MSIILTFLFRRMPIGWLQLAHNKGRLAAAVAGVAFANLLVFMQLGILGALNGTTTAPYALFNTDLIISAEDSNSLTDGSNVARVRMFQALGADEVLATSPLYIGMLEFEFDDGSSSTMQTYGVNPDDMAFFGPTISDQIAALKVENTALIDLHTRGAPSSAFDGLLDGHKFEIEVNDLTITAAGTLEMGGGFAADGTLIVSDQTFFRLFKNRSSSAPNHILVNLKGGVDANIAVNNLSELLPPDSIKVRQIGVAAQADLVYQTTERPTGVIFGFGVLIGVLVGIVIVYQVLATDVADHLREYATFKAVGYSQNFFLGVVFEEALILAVFGFFPGLLVSLALYHGLSIATGLPVAMSVGRAALVFVGTLIACTISGAIATRRLAGADPADLF